MDGVFGGDSVKPTVAVIASAEEVVKAYGDVCLRKVRRKQQKLLLLELLYEYAKNSTLHGLGYIVEKGLHYVERVFWFITFFISLAMCFFLIRNVWAKWITSPVIVSFSEKFVSVGDVPFPSLTICPEQKIDASVFNFSHYARMYEEYLRHHNEDKSLTYDKINFRKLQHLSTICGELSQPYSPKGITDESLVNDIIEAAPSMSDIFSYCSWRGKYFPCQQIFKAVLTKKGICYNFNALAADELFKTENLQNAYNYSEHTTPSKDWSSTDGYTDFTNETYPRRGMENQDNPDLDVILTEAESNDSLCNILRNGFTIYVQHPRDHPQATLYYYAAIPEQISSLALKFNRLFTANSLKAYTPEARQCYFPNDKKLRYFKIYTSYNCRLECQSNYTYKTCGCVWFHMPHDNSSQLCTMKRYYCVQKALEELSKAEVTNDNTDETYRCKCLPLCDAVQYDAEILKTNFRVTEYFKFLESRNMAVDDSMKKKKYSKIEVYFKEPRFISMRRSELFGVTDFLANCGGLLGLFLGFSFLSLVEIVYFGTLRFYFRLKKELRREKKKQREENKQ